MEDRRPKNTKYLIQRLEGRQENVSGQKQSSPGVARCLQQVRRTGIAKGSYPRPMDTVEGSMDESNSI